MGCSLLLLSLPLSLSLFFDVSFPLLLILKSLETQISKALARGHETLVRSSDQEGKNKRKGERGKKRGAQKSPSDWDSGRKKKERESATAFDQRNPSFFSLLVPLFSQSQKTNSAPFFFRVPPTSQRDPSGRTLGECDWIFSERVLREGERERKVSPARERKEAKG